jgi:hypothetical protein
MIAPGGGRVLNRILEYRLNSLDLHVARTRARPDEQVESMRFAQARGKCAANAFSMPDNFEQKSSTHGKHSAMGIPLDYRNLKAENGRWFADTEHHCSEISGAIRRAVSP